jgi:hypothetical protein
MRVGPLLIVLILSLGLQSVSFADSAEEARKAKAAVQAQLHDALRGSAAQLSDMLGNDLVREQRQAVYGIQAHVDLWVADFIAPEERAPRAIHLIEVRDARVADILKTNMENLVWSVLEIDLSKITMESAQAFESAIAERIKGNIQKGIPTVVYLNGMEFVATHDKAHELGRVVQRIERTGIANYIPGEKKPAEPVRLGKALLLTSTFIPDFVLEQFSKQATGRDVTIKDYYQEPGRFSRFFGWLTKRDADARQKILKAMFGLRFARVGSKSCIVAAPLNQDAQRRQLKLEIRNTVEAAIERRSARETLTVTTGARLIDYLTNKVITDNGNILGDVVAEMEAREAAEKAKAAAEAPAEVADSEANKPERVEEVKEERSMEEGAERIAREKADVAKRKVSQLIEQLLNYAEQVEPSGRVRSIAHRTIHLTVATGKNKNEIIVTITPKYQTEKTTRKGKPFQFRVKYNPEAQVFNRPFEVLETVRKLAPVAGTLDDPSGFGRAAGAVAAIDGIKENPVLNAMKELIQQSDKMFEQIQEQIEKTGKVKDALAQRFYTIVDEELRILEERATAELKEIKNPKVREVYNAELGKIVTRIQEYGQDRSSWKISKAGWMKRVGRPLLARIAKGMGTFLRVYIAEIQNPKTKVPGILALIPSSQIWGKHAMAAVVGIGALLKPWFAKNPKIAMKLQAAYGGASEAVKMGIMLKGILEKGAIHEGEHVLFETAEGKKLSLEDMDELMKGFEVAIVEQSSALEKARQQGKQTSGLATAVSALEMVMEDVAKIDGCKDLAAKTQGFLHFAREARKTGIAKNAMEMVENIRHAQRTEMMRGGGKGTFRGAEIKGFDVVTEAVRMATAPAK